MKTKEIIRGVVKNLPPPIKFVLKQLRNKYWSIRNGLSEWYLDVLKHHFKRQYATYLYKRQLGREINWKHPKDLNEKINWLAFCTDTSEWTRLADKYLVRDFVKERGCEEILVPLYAKYDCVEDIQYEALPSKFILKLNNGSGDATIVKDKATIDKDKIARRLLKALNSNFGLDSAEPHYLKIKPCIIAEKLLEPIGGELTDYKIWCFHGKPFCIFTCSNRNIINHTADYNIYDIQWNKQDCGLPLRFRNEKDIPCPLHLDRMLDYAHKLSDGFPQVRVDFYEVDGQIYFGEMTFTSMMGRMQYFTPEYLRLMGEQIQL